MTDDQDKATSPVRARARPQRRSKVPVAPVQPESTETHEVKAPIPVPAPATWHLIETPGKPPRCDLITDAQAARLAKRGATVTRNSSPPMAIAGENPLIAFQLEDLSFNKLQTDFVIAVARVMHESEIPEGMNPEKLTPVDYGKILPDDVASASKDYGSLSGYRALRYVFFLRRPRGSGSGWKPELIKTGHVEALSIDKRYSVDDDRTLKPSPDGLSYRIANYLSTGTVHHSTVNHQDLHKTHGQSVWHSESLIALDVQSKHFTAVRDYLRTIAKSAPEIRNRLDGLGPVRVTETKNSEDIVIFAGVTGSFETATGKPRPDYYADMRNKPGLSIFGLAPKSGTDMKLAYEEYFSLGDCCPDNPGICYAPVGLLALTPLSALNRKYRVASYTHGRSGSGKTAFEILLLSTQSPDARGYSKMTGLVTVSARPGRGGSTTNGINMVLQYAGGFRALVDDYTTNKMLPADLAQRGAGLSILVGSLEGEAPTKQTWTKAGPDFAQGYAPQSSFAVSGEILPTDLESTINRLIILQAPDADIKDHGGYSYSRIKHLDTPESGDLRHAAFCDLTRFILAQPEIADDAYLRAYETVKAWTDIDSERMLARYAVALAGWIVALERARDAYSLDRTGDLEKITRALHEIALAQYRLISQTQDMPGLLRTAIRQALDDGEICFPGPPRYDQDSGKQIDDWTAPDYRETDDPEETSDLPLPGFLSSWAQLGLTLNSGTVPGWAPASKRYAGYFRAPKAERSGRYAFPYRIQVNKDQLGIMSRILEKRGGKEGIFTEKVIRQALLSSDQIAKTGQGGGINDNQRRTIDINAEWLFAESEED